MGALYRIRQFILSIGMKFLTQESPKIIEELDRAGQVLEDKDIDRVFVMTTPGFIRRGTLEPLFEDLDKRDISYEIYTDIKPDPSIDDIVDAFAKYDKFSSQAIVGIGGGSILDASKALGAKPDTAIEDMKGTFKVKEDLPLMILVPTTAGTGSEVTVASAVTEPRENEPDYKYSIMDYALLPDYAILDSNLLVTLPSGLSATTGMDALIHEVEAYTNKFGSQDARDDALEATKLIFENLKNSYDHGENLEHRINMLYASHKAGRAFSHNYVGYVHAIAHQIGSIYGLEHGHTNAIILPHVLDYYGSSVYERLAEMADNVGIGGSNNEEKAKNFISAIRDLNEDMGISSRIEDLEEKDFDLIIQRAMKEAHPLYPTPEIWEEKDFKNVLNTLMA